jgi:PAB-dependent poly(A)-specific ribonuclease subunit 2
VFANAAFLIVFVSHSAGDLDVKTSPHTLVPSKVAYKKLRLLVDLGCVFIGHGLNKDFRIISESHPCPLKYSREETII